MALSFHDLHQLTRAAVERAQQLQVPVVISIVDAHGTETVTWRMPGAEKGLDRGGDENGDP